MATFTYLKTLNCTSAATTAGSPNLTLLATAAGTLGVVIGTKVEHPNIPVDTYIIGFSSTTVAVMSNNATVTGSSLIVVATNPTIINMSDIPAQAGYKTGNDVYNISGPKLLVDSHSRYGLNQTTSTAIGTLTLSATLGGDVEFNSTKVRLIAYTDGASDIPAPDTVISQGGASGKLIGVYPALNVAPTAAGFAMPSVGFILIRQWNSVPYAAGALTGINASSTGADRAGWLEIVGVDALLHTVNRLNKWSAFGDYFDFLGVTTSGTRTTQYQLPTNGAAMYVPGVEVSLTAPQAATYTWAANVVTVTLASHGLIAGDRVEIAFTSGDGTPSGEYTVVSAPTTGTFTFALTGAGTGGNCTVTEYEFYPNAGSQTALDTKIGTELVRGKWCWITTSGLVSFGYDGINSSGGYCPPAGRKIRVANLFFQCCAAADLTINAIPNATIANRMEFTVSGGGYVEMDKVSINWYLNFLQAFDIRLTNTFTFDGFVLSENASPINWYNVGVGCSAFNTSIALTMTYNFAGGTLNKCVFTRSTMSASGQYTISLTDITGFTFKDIRLHQIHGVRGNASSGSGLLTRMNNSTWENTVIGGGQFAIVTCADVTITNSIYYDLPAGTTVATIPQYVFPVSASSIRVKMDGLTFGGLTMCQPYSGILSVATAASYITLRNLGTYDNPLDLGDVRQEDVAWSRVGLVATVTKVNHGLKTGDRVYVRVSSAVAAVTVALKTLTGTPSADTFTFACLNAGATSGTLSYFPTMSANLFVAATGCTDILIQRCYVPHTATNLFTADNSVKNLRIDNVIGDFLNPFLTAANNLSMRSVSGSPTLAAQVSIYGTHRLDAFNADVTPNLAGQAWARTTTVCTVTSVGHNLRTGLFVNINVSSDKSAVPLGVKTVTVIDSATFTFTCLNAGAASGTLSFRTVVDRICLLMNEATAETAAQVIDKTGTANFTSAGGLMLPTLGDSITFDSAGYRYGHTGFPIQEVVMGGGVISNFNLWYAIDKNDGAGYSAFKNLYYTRQVVPLTINAAATTYTNIVKLTATKFLVVYGRATFLSACVVNIVDGDLTPGLEYSFNAVATTYISVTKMSETQAIATFVTGGFLQVCMLSISGDVVTAGPTTTINAGTTSYVAVTRLTATQAIVAYSEVALGKACTLNVSGSVITNGTPLSFVSVAATTYTSITRMSDTQAIVVQESTLNDSECFTLNVSGTDLTQGTPIFPVTGTVTYCAVTAVSSTMAVMTAVNATFIWACTLSVTGTDLTNGTVIQATAAAATYPALEMISATQVLLSYTASTTFLAACTLNITGTDLTTGTEKAVSTSVATYSSMSLVSATQAIIAYSGFGTYLQVRRLDISGTDVNCKSDGEPGGYTFSIADDDSNVAVGDYVWGTNVGGNAKITDITNGIVTVDEPHTGTLAGILRFNHIRNESLTNDGFKLKVKMTSIVNAYATAVTSLSIYTDSDDTSRARLYPLDEINLTLTGLQTGTKIAVVETGTETLLELITAVDGSATYTYEQAGGIVDIAILAPGFLYQKITSYTLTTVDTSIPILQNVDYGYNNLISATVTFNGTTKRIICAAATTSINVVGVYTEWVDWALTSDNLKYKNAFNELGGNTIDSGAGTKVPVYGFLVNTWRISPDEADHTLAVTGGIILVEGGGDPFVDTAGDFTVRINYQQPVQAIVVSVSTGSGLSEAQDAQLMKTLTVGKFLGLK